MNSIPEGFLHQPKNSLPRVKTCWAYLSVDPEDGNEGCVALRKGDAWLPLIAFDEKRRDAMRPWAEEVLNDMRPGTTIQLVKFMVRVDVETLTKGDPVIEEEKDAV